MKQILQFLCVCCIEIVFIHCNSDLEQYNELTKLRVLAIQTTPADILPNTNTTVTPLVYSPNPDTVSYQWSWCPFLNPNNPGVCLVSREQLHELIVALQLNDTLPDFDLGTNPSFDLNYPGSAELWQSLCTYLQTEPAIALSEKLVCNESFKIYLILKAQNETNTVVATKKIVLFYDENASVNQNPTIENIFIAPGKKSSIDNAVPIDDISNIELKKTYSLFATVAESNSETYTSTSLTDIIQNNTAQESLTFTWFIEQGTTKAARTVYLPFDTRNTLAKAQNNEFTSPLPEDATQSETKLFVVLRDNRGGVSWISRTLAWGQP